MLNFSEATRKPRSFIAPWAVEGIAIATMTTAAAQASFGIALATMEVVIKTHSFKKGRQLYSTVRFWSFKFKVLSLKYLMSGIWGKPQVLVDSHCTLISIEAI